MKGIILLGDYFEETEALSCVDVLKRAGEEITLVSVMQTLQVFTKSGYQIIAEKYLDEIKESDYDYLILPGGKAAFTILNKDSRVELLISQFIKSDKLVASICAAPHLLGRKGYFNNLDYTIFPGFEKYCISGNYQKDKGVVIAKNFITAKSMYYTIEFALAIIYYLYDENKARQVWLNCKGE